MLSSVSRLGGVLSELKLLTKNVVPKLSVQSPMAMSVSHLRTGAVNNKMRLKSELPEELPEGQTIVKHDVEMKREVMDKINDQLDAQPGRLFAVVHVRGHQHKVTSGQQTNTKLQTKHI